VFNHAPPDYRCPFCLLVAGVENEHVRSVQTDIVYRGSTVLAFIAAKQWPNNRGHVLVIPAAHFENLYDLPDALGADIHRVACRVAIAMKTAYGCAGVSTRQHNEPAGNQDVWHYHLHVFPRYPGDDLYGSRGAFLPAGERARYARRLRAALNETVHEDGV
jgi:histidine triad (HIT) family protein